MGNKFVFDSYALLAYFYNEPGATQLEELLDLAERAKVVILLNEINLGEVYYRAWKDRGETAAKEILQLCLALPIDIVQVEREFILQAAEYKARNRISYADAFCVVTAKREDCPIITGDPEFASVEHIEIIWIKDLKGAKSVS